MAQPPFLRGLELFRAPGSWPTGRIHRRLLNMPEFPMDPARPGAATQDQNGLGEIGRSVGLFLRWLDAHAPGSYDPYDIWGTKYGLWSRRLFYAKRFAGTPFIAPILLLEILCPQARALFVSKKRYATGDAN